ncbi:MAG: aspartate 1-decarboxylase [Candidatus Cloacimonetes bacterium]|nr:aspartate 1-decarboxylase [Candidatus Cloacimonadota bacterium]
MLRTMLYAKIHRATVTETDLNYVGSITIDKDLLDETGILPNEKVEIYDIDNGNRFATYVIEGKAGSGIIGVNGAAARLVRRGDKVIIVSFVQLNQDELKGHVPTVVIVNDKNKIIEHKG